ncbi:hypothetical protein SAMN05877809_10910 [Rhodobacter sp. JA431]|nr:hypothetical protein SAMN05877809_10910 [Rhodobacter sp. JA431]
MSANQLAEYTLASPTRRQTILRNAKYSPTFLVTRYGAAKSAICDYLADDTRQPSQLALAEQLQIDLSKSDGTAYSKNDAALSAEAISNFRGMIGPNFLKGLTFTVNTSQLPKLPIAGVDVSVNLDLVSRNIGKGRVGGVLLQTSKAVASKGWREDHSKCVSSLVWMLASKHLQSLGEVDRKLCLAIDVFAMKTTPAPSNYKRTLANIEASCAEIAMFWPHISPPSDFDGA